MALDTTSLAQDWHQLVELDLGNLVTLVDQTPDESLDRYVTVVGNYVYTCKYVAATSGTLRVYNWNGQYLELKDSLSVPEPNGLWNDGTYVYLSATTGGSPYYVLRAYQYAGGNLAQVGGEVGYAGGYPKGFATDGTTLFFALTWSPVSGKKIQGYTFDGSTFSATVASGLTYAGSEDCLTYDGTYLYLANGGSGIAAYNTSLAQLGTRDDGGEAKSVATARGTIFLANQSDLRAYTFDGSTFSNTATYSTGTSFTRVFTQGRYIHVNIDSNLDTFTYSGSAFTLVDTQSMSGARLAGNAEYVFGGLGSASAGLRVYRFLTSQYIRAADRVLALDNGNLYERRITSVGRLSSTAGRLLNPTFELPQVSVTLDDGNGELRELAQLHYGFAGDEVTLKVGQGNAAADYETRVTGQVRFPDGVQWGDDYLRLLITSNLLKDTSNIPPNKVFPDTYPNAESKSTFKTIPEILGDWRTTAGGGETVPCFCVDTTAGTGGQFIIAESCASIEDVYINGVSAAYTQNSLEPALFTLDAAYDSDTDIVTANVQGRASALEGKDNPVDWIYTLLTDAAFAGLAAGRVDTSSFTTASRGMGPQDTARRWIGEDIALTTLLAELATEAFVDLVLNESGQYKPVERIAGDPASTTVAREQDIVSDGNGRRAFAIAADPERTYCNQVVADYGALPAKWSAEFLDVDYKDRWRGSVQVDDTTAQTNYGQTRRRRLPLKWLYQAAAATDRANREKLAFSTLTEQLEIDLGARFLTLTPGDQFQLIYSRYEKTPILGTQFMARTVQTDYQGMRVSVEAWNLDNVIGGRWTADTAAAYVSASTYERDVNGYWEVGSGSYDSYWF